MPKARRRLAVAGPKMTVVSRLAAMTASVVVSGLLLGCGSGGGNVPSYSLAVSPPQSLTTTKDSIVLTGDGFLPTGSSCSSGCELLGPPVFGNLGQYKLTWSNAANGQSGETGLTWICNCGGNAPGWIAIVPLAVGANAITITESDKQRSEQVAITITRN